MKLFAQHGAQEGDKITLGLEAHLLDGVIFSPKDVSLDSLKTKLNLIATNHPSVSRMFDPQYYAIFLNGIVEARLGHLADDFGAYFKTRRRSQLEREHTIMEDVNAAIRFQQELPLSTIIAPNIFIPGSLNSIESVISKNFIRLTAECLSKIDTKGRALATLAVSRNSLIDKRELVEFMNEITALDPRPDGFYLLVGAQSADARAEIFNTDVIAGWMFMNHVLNVNGFEVVNGYSDLLTPFLGSAGGSAGAFGWWSNLRTFSLDRFSPSVGGGRLPIPRYLSAALLNRITHFELDQLKRLLPDVVNNLPTDSYYEDEDGGSQPERALEVVQSWETIQSLNRAIIVEEQVDSLGNCKHAIKRASEFYDSISLRLDSKSNSDHLQALDDGIDLFKRLAEI